MKTFQQILEQSVKPQLLFNITYGSILISPILGGEFTALFVLIGYINFLYIAKGRAIDPIAKVCIGGLTISAIAVLVLALVHLDDMLSGLGKPVNTIISVGWFGVFFMLLDAVLYQIYKYDIDLQNFARFLLTLIFITLLVKMAWIYFSAESIELRDFFTTSNRKILLVNLNPNHADNIIVFQIVMIVWALFKLERDGRTVLYMMVAFAACAYLVYLFMVINSRVGLIGCFMAIVIAILMNSHRLSKSGFFILFCFAVNMVM